MIRMVNCDWLLEYNEMKIEKDQMDIDLVETEFKDENSQVDLDLDFF